MPHEDTSPRPSGKIECREIPDRQGNRACHERPRSMKEAVPATARRYDAANENSVPLLLHPSCDEGDGGKQCQAERQRRCPAEAVNQEDSANLIWASGPTTRAGATRRGLTDRA